MKARKTKKRQYEGYKKELRNSLHSALSGKYCLEESWGTSDYRVSESSEYHHMYYIEDGVIKHETYNSERTSSYEADHHYGIPQSSETIEIKEGEAPKDKDKYELLGGRYVSKYGICEKAGGAEDYDEIILDSDYEYLSPNIFRIMYRYIRIFGWDGLIKELRQDTSVSVPRQKEIKTVKNLIP